MGHDNYNLSNSFVNRWVFPKICKLMTNKLTFIFSIIFSFQIRYISWFRRLSSGFGISLYSEYFVLTCQTFLIFRILPFCLCFLNNHPAIMCSVHPMSKLKLPSESSRRLLLEVPDNYVYFRHTPLNFHEEQ